MEMNSISKPLNIMVQSMGMQYIAFSICRLKCISNLITKNKENKTLNPPHPTPPNPLALVVFIRKANRLNPDTMSKVLPVTL